MRSANESHSGGTDHELQKRGGIGLDQTVELMSNNLLRNLLAVESSFENQNPHAISQLIDSFLDGHVAFSTTIMRNASRGLPSASCTCTIVSEGDLASGAVEAFAIERFGRGIGIGYDLSEVTDISWFVRRLNHSLATINVPLLEESKRPVAAMATVADDHPDLEAFLTLGGSFTPLITRSLWISDSTMQEELRIDLSSAEGTLLFRIAESISSSGNPGILFRDRFDAANPTPESSFVSTAPCGEVALAADDLCHIGYVSLHAFALGPSMYDFDALYRATRLLTRGLDNCVQLACNHASSDEEPFLQYRRISIGSTGLANALRVLGYRYGSDESLLFVSRVAEVIDHASKSESVLLAKERGAFPSFAKSRYSQHSWFEQQRLDRLGYVPRYDWARLARRISEIGLRNATTTAMPSAETASAYLGVNPTLEPFGYKSPERHPPVSSTDEIQVMSRFQPWLDGAISKTLTVPASTGPDQIRKLIMDAYGLGVKGISIYKGAVR